MFQRWPKRDPVKHYYLVPNEVFSLGLSSYECFLLGKHTVERVCSGLSPLRRDRLWC